MTGRKLLGIIGERYGWVPEAIDPDLMTAQPWLQEHPGKSVTELEILHGVLNDPAMAGNAFFYFRDPAYARDKPAENFVEASAERRRQLEELKERIRQAHRDGKLKHAPRENFANAKALGELVKKDLGDIIENTFPADATPDALSRDIAEHEAAGRSRLRVYVAREEYLRRLDEHVAGDGPPLVVLGESGAGKTALLANWVARWRGEKQERKPHLIQHYIGATPASTDWVAMARRVLGELNRTFDLKLEIPDQPAALRMAFANGLYRAAAAGRVVLVLDALNQLEDRDQAPDLAWLPPAVPPNVRLIVSTLPGRSLDELRRRQWPNMTVGLLSTEERQELIPRYLKQVGKSLTTDQVNKLANAEQTKNPLFLRTLLEELRVWGEHETLGQKIDDYLGAESIPALFEKVFIRWEEDYEGDTDLVGDVLSLLVSARRGLSVHELLQILGGEQPLPRAVLAPLLYAAGDVLVDRSGLLNLTHDFARQAVLDSYLPAGKTKRWFHQRLAHHFCRQPLSPRKVDELPWQLERAEEWQQLADLLSEAAFFEALWDANQFDVRAHWASIERSSHLRISDAYARMNEREAREAVTWKVSILLDSTGHPNDAFAIRQQLADRCRANGDTAKLGGVLGGQAVILQGWGRFDEAYALLKEEERIWAHLQNADGLSACLGNQANILYAQGHLDEAMSMNGRVESAHRQLGNWDGLAKSLGNQALILADQGRLDDAMALLREQETICRRFGNWDTLSKSLGNQALVLMDRGSLGEATAQLEEQERICRQFGNWEGLAICLGNQALILMDRRDPEGAMALLKEQERICRQLDDWHGLSCSLGNQGLILMDRREPAEAIDLFKEQERICRQLKDQNGLATSLGNQAVILQAAGAFTDAMTLHKEAELICRELRNPEGLHIGLGNQAAILQAWGKTGEALSLLKEKENICRAIGNPEGLATSLVNQAMLLARKGLIQEARGKRQEGLTIAQGCGLTALLHRLENLPFPG